MTVSNSMRESLKQVLLTCAAATVACIALCYGVNPRWFAQTFLGVSELNLNLAHILRAVMGLYLALSIFWLLCAFKKNQLDIALVTLMIFSGGLLLGRILSMLADGQPSNLLLFYAGIELAVLPLAWWLVQGRDGR